MSKYFHYFFVIFSVLTVFFLLFSVFPQSPYKLLIVRSGSMAPKLKQGSIIMIMAKGIYKIGEVITFKESQDSKKLTTHRIYDIAQNRNEIFYITKGDANFAPDAKKIKAEEILGKVVFRIPYFGYLANFAKTKTGLLLLILIPAGLLMLQELKKIIQELKN